MSVAADASFKGSARHQRMSVHRALHYNLIFCPDWEYSAWARGQIVVAALMLGAEDVDCEFSLLGDGSLQN